jgi:hypothetical protein
MAEVEGVSPREDGADWSGLASETAIYLFAFADRIDALRPPPPDAALERRLTLLGVGSLAALVGVVPAADYSGPDSERNLSDIAWLAPRVRRHGELVEWLTRSSPVYPAPFATLYASLDNLTAFMHAHEATIAAFLRAVADKEEWELRAFAHFDDPEALDRLACEAWPDWRDLSRGARYMRLCRDRGALIDFARAEAAAFARDFVAELGGLTSDARSLALSSSVAADGREPVARYALLVAKTGVAAIRVGIQDIGPRASSRHAEIALSGPWPPFSFRPDLK